MNLTLAEAIILGGQIEKTAESVKHLEIVIAPPSVFIYPIFERLKARPDNLHFALQNSMWDDEGAYTGEISLSMVRGVCRYAIIGHSERRKIFKEESREIAKKVLFALSKKITPIVCVGEQQRFHLEDHYQSEVARMKKDGGILQEIKDSLQLVPEKEIGRVIISYEPIWAIGTGNAASGAYAAAICHIIKQQMEADYGNRADDLRVLYGGSVDSANCREFMMQPSIDGLLVGGASLKSSEFAKICQISSEVKSGKLV
ncbi:MAG: Triosephosphate isomerase [candidate division WS2 bacterium ADurb.Bin280]|uniref:Triosephosphate isomerase n=1 Tax=candidate division WS2 bacterium ADurb.Bin280 TaxID=1852829 RepID=A0A1V5SBL6_9BACT|nr:MAG: Triosephosphate isomerase [candidate division WS2 bacterium ADurb.Bin280]